ncbi:MAG: hypothetical protein LKF38_06920 [Bifidobacterium sp.]|nr:hypothetical protein [Bifidobacterium sp.]
MLHVDNHRHNNIGNGFRGNPLTVFHPVLDETNTATDGKAHAQLFGGSVYQPMECRLFVDEAHQGLLEVGIGVCRHEYAKILAVLGDVFAGAFHDLRDRITIRLSVDGQDRIARPIQGIVLDLAQQLFDAGVMLVESGTVDTGTGT